MQILFHDQTPVKGSKAIITNVTRNGQPFGQIWTFRRERGITDFWHASALSGEQGHSFRTKDAAKAFLVKLANDTAGCRKVG